MCDSVMYKLYISRHIMYNNEIFNELVRRMECKIEMADNNECQLFTGYKKGITILIKISYVIKIKRML